MKRPVAPVLAPVLAAAMLALAAPAFAQPDEQAEARKEMRAGNQLSLQQIEALVIPRMGDQQYLGPAYDPTAMAYRLKFIDNKSGRISYVDVDARTGRVLGVTR